MDDMRIGTLLAVLLPLLVIGEVVVGLAMWRATGHPMPAFLRGPTSGAARRVGVAYRLVGTWLAVTIASLWVGFLIAFVVVHALLFLVGDSAAFAGLVVSVIVLGSMPIAWAVVLIHRSRA